MTADEADTVRATEAVWFVRCRLDGGPVIDDSGPYTRTEADEWADIARGVEGITEVEVFDRIDEHAATV